MTRERGRLVAVAVLATGLGLAGAAGLAAQQRAASGASANGTWPQFRGPNRDGRSADTNLLKQWDADGPSLVWKTSGLGTGYSSLSISGDRLFTMGDLEGSQYVIALSATDGSQLWKAKVGPIWQDRYPGPRATPTVDGQLIYSLGTEGDLVCLEAATGKERWRKNLARDFGGQVMSDWKFTESPLIDGDRVVVTPGAADASLVALNKLTGATIWKAKVPALGQNGRDGAGYSSVVISNGAGVKQYVQLLGRGVVGIRAADGEYLWGYNRVANGVANIPTPIVQGDFVFAASGYQTGSALLKLAPAAGGKVTATEVYFLDGKTFQNHHGGFVLVDGYIYGGHGHRAGLPVCVEFATGTLKWGGDIRNDGRGSAAIAYADGHVYYRYENGLVILVEATPTGYKEKGKLQLETSDLLSWAYPVIVGGRMYLRDKDHLYVYDLRKA
ncbi:MAG: PQQ-binding-like beta-propeller repeat protein [Vicinamibacteraceae bacterium]